MALESAADFTSYVNSTTGFGITGTFFEVQDTLWDTRAGLIDTWYDIDSGASSNIDILMDEDYFSIEGNSVAAEGYQPKATIKASDAPYASHLDKLIVNAITTDQGNVIKAETTFFVVEVQPDNVGMITLILEAA
jgi:hypothetical protein|tara:strand:+ start:7913 stop:8317 length:405 start_codon:yes stop_codon:yes gene_type:complete